MDTNNETIYFVGKNSEDNWRIYKESNQNDTIFHLNKFSSPYVIIKIPIKDITNQQIYTAANICKQNSKYKNLPKVSVMYTPISNTRLGNKVGSFTTISNHKVKVINV